MELQVFFNVLLASIISGVISTQAIQYIKKHFKFKNCCVFGIFSFLLGSLFAFSFGDFSLIDAIWSGFLSVIGAEQIYKALEGKLGFTSFSDMIGSSIEPKQTTNNLAE